MSAIFAIDYGTSNSLICLANKERVFPLAQVDKDSSKPEILKSWMYFQESKKPIFGESALRVYSEDPTQGRLLRSLKAFLPDAAFEGTWIDGQYVKFEELLGRFLRELKLRAEKEYQMKSNQLLLGRPAIYHPDPKLDQLAVNRMTKAAELAGFEGIQFYPEPLAAAHMIDLQEESLALIADFGAGTSDFSLIRFCPRDEMEVLGVSGISVAGDKFDGSIMQHFIAKHFAADLRYRLPMSDNTLKMPNDILFKLRSPHEMIMMSKTDVLPFLRELENTQISDADKDHLDALIILLEDYLGFQIYSEIEKTKINLSENKMSEFSYDYPGILIREWIEQESFIENSMDKIEQIMNCLDEVFLQSGIAENKVEQLFTTGGTSQLPHLKTALKKNFPQFQDLQTFQSVIQGLGKKAQKIAHAL